MLRATICEEDAGGDQDACRAFLLDVTKEGELSRVIEQVESEYGEIDCAVYNLGANMGIRGLERTPLKVMDRALKLGCLGAYFAASAVVPKMAERGRGTFLLTGATAGLRGNAGQLAHASGMFARRGMSQSLAHEYGPQGVVSLSIILSISVCVCVCVCVCSLSSLSLSLSLLSSC